MKPRPLGMREMCPQCGHFAEFHTTLGSMMDSACRFTYDKSSYEGLVNPSDLHTRQFVGEGGRVRSKTEPLVIEDPETLEQYRNPSRRGNDLAVHPFIPNRAMEDDVLGEFAYEGEVDLYAEPKDGEPHYLDIPFEVDAYEEAQETPEDADARRERILQELIYGKVDDQSGVEVEDIRMEREDVREYFRDNHPKYSSAKSFSDLPNTFDYEELADDIDWKEDGHMTASTKDRWNASGANSSQRDKHEEDENKW